MWLPLRVFERLARSASSSWLTFKTWNLVEEHGQLHVMTGPRTNSRIACLSAANEFGERTPDAPAVLLVPLGHLLHVVNSLHSVSEAVLDDVAQNYSKHWTSLHHRRQQLYIIGERLLQRDIVFFKVVAASRPVSIYIRRSTVPYGAVLA